MNSDTGCHFGDALVVVTQEYYRDYVQQLEKYYEFLLQEQKDLVGLTHHFVCEGCNLLIYDEDSPECECEDIKKVCYRCTGIIDHWKPTSCPNVLKCERCGFKKIRVEKWKALPKKPLPPFVPK
jgi:hypothetical protein